MLDIKLIRENPELVKENIRKKFQDHKLVLVDEVLELDESRRAVIAEVEAKKARKNEVSKQIPMLKKEKKDILLMSKNILKAF